MGSKRTRFVLAAGVTGVVAVVLAGCGTSGAPFAGTPTTAAPSTSTTPSTSTPSVVAGPTSSAPATTAPTTAAPTVTVTALPQPRRRTVTRVVQVPGDRTVKVAPGSSGQLNDLYESTTFADSNEYYTDGGVFFDAPSQNIGCFIADAGSVSCAIKHYDFAQPGPDCDAGIGATVDGYGNPSLTDCSGYFPVENRATVLPYGYSVTDGYYACVSESSGVTCFDTSTGSGFSLSKEAYSPVYS